MQAENQEPINFYRKQGDHGFFSNFYLSPFKVGEIQYKTNEHYFQSKKFEGNAHQLTVATAKTPFDAFNLGRSRQHPLRKDWQQIKQKIMYEGLRHKFTQNADLKQKILATGNRKLIEHTQKDKYWGDGLDGSGKNRLGELLMKLRQQIRQSK